MFKKATFLFILLFFGLPTQVLAIYDQLSVPNNRYGIHIHDESNLTDAEKLVNSTGGEWGYVTFVITEKERDTGRWQKVFDEMRRKHLIPIVRIATKVEGDKWSVPQDSEIDTWVEFLETLNWVVKNRYIVIGNEPNHAKEWGGKISPAEYADYLKKFSQKLKETSEDFYVLPAGLDASAPDSSSTMDERKFLAEMLESEPDIFDYVDGWTSHSYPNPAFSGLATDVGKGTIRTYDWELSYLNSLGITKNLPVFITETGWSNKNLSEEEIGKRLIFAFNQVWDDQRVVAVTPFILNYPEEPFDEFSWVKKDGSFYSFYDQVKQIEKVKGEPIQQVKGKIIGAFVNPVLIVASSFKGVVLAQNLGQSIWVKPEISIDEESQVFALTTDDFGELEPNHIKLLYFRGKAPDLAGKYSIPLVLKYKDKIISETHPLESYVVKAAEVKNLSLFAKIQVWIKRLLGQ